MKAVYVIGNNNHDLAIGAIERKSGKVSYINVKENLGEAGCFQLGCEIALSSNENFTHFWLMHDDTIVDHKCLQQLFPYLDKKTILQPMRYNQRGMNIEQSATHVDLKSVMLFNHKRHIVNETAYSTLEYPFNLDVMSFEGALIPRQIFKFAGLPDKSYFTFGDELDFALRARKLGFKISCIPKAKIICLKDNALRQHKQPWKAYFLYRNFFKIQRVYGENWFVRNRPYLTASLLMIYHACRLEFKIMHIVMEALEDSRAHRFSYHDKYIPKY